MLGTHGRSIIVLDDATLLEKADAAVLAEEVHLFPARPATEYYEMRMLPFPGAAKFAAPNPDYGAFISYYLKGAPAPDATVKIEILDRDNHLVREIVAPDRQGMNRVAWDLRYPLTFTPAAADEGWFGPPKGTLVLPGEYRIKLTARGRQQTGTVQVRQDPRSRTTPEALQARFDASQRVSELIRSFVEASVAADRLSSELEEHPGGAQKACRRSERQGRQSEDQLPFGFQRAEIPLPRPRRAAAGVGERADRGAADGARALDGGADREHQHGERADHDRRAGARKRAAVEPAQSVCAAAGGAAEGKMMILGLPCRHGETGLPLRTIQMSSH